MHLIKIAIIIPALILLTGTLYTQDIDINKLKLDHYLNQHPVRTNNFRIFSVVPDTLFIYAARVQFIQDNNTNTTGNGRMDLSNNYPDSVDAPPHNDTYFSDHLEFVKNYFEKSSKGKLVVKYELIADLRNLPSEMSEYSPGKNENLAKIGKLFNETWRSVDSVYDFSNIDPARSAFIIFHAGVGRDIDLLSQGIFQGQLDIPSLYFGLKSIRSVYGDTAMGYHTNEGFVINNSSILPEQEWRIIESQFGDTYLELGVNGIITATIGSHLGLPDLFNTETGNTAIGRFGLMDGQSIFSYMGVFPPEPSAWEKQYLGWVTPVLVLNNGAYTSIAASLDLNGNQSVHKVFISGKEYFLAENRNRDAYNNGQTVHYIQNGIRDSITFTEDQNGFEATDVWKLKGSIVDVDEFDWSLPGLKNDTASFMGGILIWHIDENVIDAKIESNTINNDINHKGVDLEEAKGSQNIGVEVPTPFGTFIGEGTIVDYWFHGDHLVPTNIYKNEFTPTSIPNSKSYSGIDSRICIRNFSVIAPQMTFNFEYCSPVTNIPGFPRFVGTDTSVNSQPIGIDLDNNSFEEIFINVNGMLYGYRDNGNSLNTGMPDGLIADSIARYLPALVNRPINTNPEFIVSSYNNSVNVITFNLDSISGVPIVIRYPVTENITSPVLNLNNDTLLFGSQNGKLFTFPLDLFPVYETDSVSNAQIRQLAELINNGYAFTQPEIKFITIGNFTGSSLNPDTVSVTDNDVLIIQSEGNTVQLNLGYIGSSPVVADINKDGNMDVIFPAGNKLYAVNKFGVSLDNFPFSVPGNSLITGGVSIADINNDGVYDLIFGTGNGNVFAYDVNGKVLPGFPLLTGRAVNATPAIINSGGYFGIIAYSTDGYLYGWRTQLTYDSSKILWSNYLKDSYHSNTNGKTEAVNVNITDCMPDDKVYNWPNPVYGNSTNIRYFLNGDAGSVKIRIMDLSGELVTALTGTVNKGFENEVVWDVTDVQSGIYIGVIETEGGSCSKAVTIKIAIVK